MIRAVSAVGICLLLAPLRAPAQQPRSSTQDQITVTASRTSVPLGETAKSVSVLGPEDLHDFPALTLDEALRQHAGFELFRRAPSRIANPGSEGISLRGLGSTAASRTLVLLDGAPLNDAFLASIHWNEIPAPAVQGVNLVTGGGSDLYGSSALGGVVDVTPETPGPARMELWVAGGAESTSNLSAVVTADSRPAGLLLAGESLRTAGYRLVDPAVAGAVDTPANVRSQAWRTELGRRNLGSRRLFLTGNLLNEDRANGTPLQTNATRLWRYLAGFDAPETRAALGRVRLFGSQEGFRQSFSSVAPTRASETLTRLQRIHTQEFGATGDATLHRGGAALVFGADLRDLRGRDDETPITRGQASGLQAVTARQRYIGGFAELLGTRAAWSGAASLRADRASNLDIVQTNNGTRSSPPDRTEIVLSPRLGVIRTFGSRADVHASGFRAFRAPSFNELYRTGQVGQEITLANAALLSERATGWELGTRLGLAGRTAELTATWFDTLINRPVSAVLISQTATTLTNQRENLGQIRSRGVETALSLFAARPLSAVLGYQFAQATVTKFSAQPALVGNWIPQVPRHTLTAQFRAVRARLGELTVAARASGQAFDDSSNQYPLAGFFALDLSGRHTFWSSRSGRRVEAFFVVQNVTNQRAQVSRTPVLTLGSPLFAEAGVRVHLGAAAP